MNLKSALSYNLILISRNILLEQEMTRWSVLFYTAASDGCPHYPPINWT